jgi:hypothetical protein
MDVATGSRLNRQLIQPLKGEAQAYAFHLVRNMSQEERERLRQHLRSLTALNVDVRQVLLQELNRQ